jgi:anaerobic sulfite reductase subunit A
MNSKNFTEDELKELNQYRKSIYTFLSRIYREEVDQKLIDSLKGKDLLLSHPESEITQGWEILRDFLQTASQNPIPELAVEYTNIFLGTGKNPAYPFESVYRTKQRLEMQRPRDEVIETYRGEGFKKGADFNEPEDHIAVELEFMAHLAQKTITALESGDQAKAKDFFQKQVNFLKQHLNQWVGPFCQDIEQGAESGFYKGIAKITKGFVSLDNKLLNEQIRGQVLQ